MNARRRKALDLLMTQQPEKVAEDVGVRLTTLENWMRMSDFRDALREREQEQKRALGRISRQAAINAAETLGAFCEAPTKDGPRLDPKVLLDVIKASGAFDGEAEDPGAGLEEIMRRAMEGDDD